MTRCILYIGILIGAFGCGQNHPALRTGDLLFMVSEKSAMTGAIVAATGKDSLLSFSHVGIFCGTQGADSVLEASTERGVAITSLQEFLDRAARTGGKPAVIAMRLKDTTGVAAAVERASTHLGLPYDYSFLPDNGQFYCSELVWESYRTPDSTHRFAAQPMNFRAADGTMPLFWTELFGQLGEPIPQGVPGTNPNDMARDGNLKEVYRWF